jgi:hypothetical protein
VVESENRKAQSWLQWAWLLLAALALLIIAHARRYVPVGTEEIWGTGGAIRSARSVAVGRVGTPRVAELSALTGENGRGRSAPRRANAERRR